MNLPPLPTTHYRLYTPSDGYCDDYLTSWDGWDDDQMRAYAEAAVLAERERCAKVCKALAAEYAHSELPGFVLELAAERIAKR